MKPDQFIHTQFGRFLNDHPIPVFRPEGGDRQTPDRVGTGNLAFGSTDDKIGLERSGTNRSGSVRVAHLRTISTSQDLGEMILLPWAQRNIGAPRLRKKEVGNVCHSACLP
jgi:hypothetical protein